METETTKRAAPRRKPSGLSRSEALALAAHRGGHPFLAWLGKRSVSTFVREHTELGVKQPSVQNWINGHRRAPRTFAEAVEKLSAGAVPVSAWGSLQNR